MPRLTLIASLILMGNSVTAGNLCESSRKEVQAMCAEVNRLRADSGVDLLRLDRQLTQTAETYAREIAEQHGAVPAELRTSLSRAGIAAVENAGGGSAAPEQIARVWRGSPRQFRSLVSAEYRKLGVAYHDGYWVQLLN